MDRKKLIISCQENNVCCSIFSVNVVFIQGRIYVTTCLGEMRKKINRENFHEEISAQEKNILNFGLIHWVQMYFFFRTLAWVKRCQNLLTFIIILAVLISPRFNSGLHCVSKRNLIALRIRKSESVRQVEKKLALDNKLSNTSVWLLFCQAVNKWNCNFPLTDIFLALVLPVLFK